MSDNYDNYIDLDGWWDDFTGDMDAPEPFDMPGTYRTNHIESILHDPESGFFYSIYSIPRPTGRMISWYRATPDCPWENVNSFIPSFVFDSDNYEY